MVTRFARPSSRQLPEAPMPHFSKSGGDIKEMQGFEP